jgi:hypothetical protein
MLGCQYAFGPEKAEELFALLPAAPAVFLLRGGDATAEPYAGKSANLRRRIERLLGEPEHGSKRLNLRALAKRLEFQPVGSSFEMEYLLYLVLRKEFPASYAKRLHLRPAPLLKLILDNPHPRVAFTSRVASLRGRNRYYGPFPSRAAAEEFAEGALNFFLVRRCSDDLHPAPEFPGCAYQEMKMCLAPCNCSCTEERYAAEVERLRAFLESGGESLRRELEAERESASRELAFEAAAAAHQRIEKLQPLLQRMPEYVRPLAHWRGVMVQPSRLPDAVELFRIEGGMISPPETLLVSGKQLAGKVKTPASMESRIAAALETAAPSGAASAVEWMEHVALLRRWLYKSSRVGEIFLADGNGELPMRRIVRGVARVFKGEAPQPELNQSAGDYWIQRGREVGL